MPNQVVKGFNVNGSTVKYDYESLEDRILKSSIANEYSSLSTYSVGDYVLYAGQLYRCIVSVTTAQDFNISKWEEVSIGNELKRGTGGSGLTQAQFESIAALFRLAVYDSDPSEAYATFVAAFSPQYDIYQNGSVLTINGGVSASQVSNVLTLS